MTLNITDALVILFILLGAVVGFKQGAIKEGVHFVGIIVISVISFLLKDTLMILMYENLPFFNFFGLLEGVTVINILLYQLIAFLIIFSALTFLLRVLLVITGLIEWLLKLTIFLQVPSKILGIFVGALEYYVYIFLVLYILNMPVLNLTFVQESQLGTQILENTPILSGLVDETIQVYTNVYDILKENQDQSSIEKNTSILKSMIDNKLVSKDSAKKLVESDKILITDRTILD